jgi:hypothetical protein
MAARAKACARGEARNMRYLTIRQSISERQSLTATD